MIACLLHQPALRRHLDDGAPLSSRTQSHLASCGACREMVAEHRQIIAALETRRQRSVDTPHFLHSRVMAGLRKNQPNQPIPSRSFSWVIPAVAMVAVIIASIWISQNRVPQKAASWPEFKTAFALQTTIPRNPLELEIENLRTDTLNATKALAASFTASSGAKK